MLGLTFSVIVSACDEAVDESAPPAAIVRELSARKARHVAALCAGDDVVLAADTLVFLDGALLSKPADAQEAHAMLRRLSGRTHEVFTGVTLITGGAAHTSHQRTLVTFKPLTDAEIDAYVASGAPLDKAGAYGIQDRGALFVSRIEGDFYNVMGLPLCLLGEMLRQTGLPVVG